MISTGSADNRPVLSLSRDFIPIVFHFSELPVLSQLNFKITHAVERAGGTVTSVPTSYGTGSDRSMFLNAKGICWKST
jgi:hypothetical protein